MCVQALLGLPWAVWGGQGITAPTQMPTHQTTNLPQHLHAGKRARPGLRLPHRRKRQRAGPRPALRRPKGGAARLPGTRGLRPLLVRGRVLAGQRVLGCAVRRLLLAAPPGWCGCLNRDAACLPTPRFASSPAAAPPPGSSLAFQPPEELRKTLEVAREAGVTVVSLPLVNQWTQDRSHEGGRTPRWRGVTLLHELRAVRGVAGPLGAAGGVQGRRCRRAWHSQRTATFASVVHTASAPAAAPNPCCCACRRACPPPSPRTTCATSFTRTATWTCWRSSRRCGVAQR